MPAALLPGSGFCTVAGMRGFLALPKGEVSIELETVAQEVLLTLTHRQLSGERLILNVCAGWHAHLALLVALALYKGKDYKNLLRQPQAPDQASTRDGVKVILKTPSLLLAYLSGGLGTLQWVPVVFFLPTWLNREHGVTVQSASLMTSGLMLLAIVSVPLGGWLMDRLNHRDDRAKVI